jgi:hypothetical protein
MGNWSFLEKSILKAMKLTAAIAIEVNIAVVIGPDMVRKEQASPCQVPSRRQLAFSCIVTLH